MSAYRVAVCEDDPADRSRLTTLCRELLSARSVEAELLPFSSADRLWAALEEGRAAFDLYLLDIQMDGTSGLELARRLHDRGIRERVIFVTANPEYALAGYDAHPLHFLLKPVDRARLDAALALALERHAPKTMLLQRGGKAAVLPLGEIRCLESRNHGVVVHLGDGERFFALSLTEAERLAPAGGFARCHKSYLVNLEWVESVARAGVLLRDGRRLPVSRSHYIAFQSALIRYLNQRKG